MILKSDGATLYDTTDLATIVERMKLFDRSDYLYYQRDKNFILKIFVVLEDKTS